MMEGQRIKDSVIQSPLECTTHSTSTGSRGRSLNAYSATQDLGSGVDLQVSVLSLQDKFDTNPLAPESWKTWLNWARNPNQEL